MEVEHRSILQKFTESARFLVRFILRAKTVGSIIPSSHFLAREIVRQIPKHSLGAPKRYILEIGPGTGVFTDKIIKRLGPEDELDLVEFDASFCELLREKYKHLKNVHVYHMSILDYQERLGEYTHIVSALPLNSFTPDFVHKYFPHIQRLSKPGTTLSSFEYIFLPEIKQIYLRMSGKNLKLF
jgi:phospholipid N-methyltransferase